MFHWIANLFSLVAIGLLLWIWLVLLPRRRGERRMRGYDLAPPYLLPPLPREMDRAVWMPSRVKPLVRYKVNLHRLSCTCDSFRNRRGFFPANDIHRLCRHLRKELVNTNAIQLFDELTQRIIQDRVRDKFYHRVTLLGTDMAFGFHPRSPYVRIFTRRRREDDPEKGPFTGPYDKYVYNLTQENWVYGELPPGNSQITAAVALLMEQMRAQVHKLDKSDEPPKEVD